MQPQSPGGQQLPPMPAGQFPQPFTPLGKPKGHSHLGWILTLVALFLLLLGALGFGLWAFSERSTYKDKTDAVVAKEVELAVKKNTSEKENEFLEREKSPYREYIGSNQFGSVTIKYPKTWAAYIAEKDSGPKLIDGYLHPSYVKALDSGTSFALRVELLDQHYDEELKKMESRVKAGKVTITPFRAAKVPQILGSRLEGEIENGKKESMIMLPIRDKVLKISTQADQFVKDFNDIILPNLVFVP